MTTKMRILLLCLLVIVFFVIINMVKKRQLELKYVLVWLCCDAALFFLTCFPRLMDRLAWLMGIYSPMNMIFFVGFVLAMVIIFSLTVSLSRLSAKLRRIAQVLAMLPDDVKKDLLKDED